MTSEGLCNFPSVGHFFLCVAQSLKKYLIKFETFLLFLRLISISKRKTEVYELNFSMIRRKEVIDMTKKFITIVTCAVLFSVTLVGCNTDHKNSSKINVENTIVASNLEDETITITDDFGTSSDTLDDFDSISDTSDNAKNISDITNDDPSASDSQMPDDLYYEPTPDDDTPTPDDDDDTPTEPTTDAPVIPLDVPETSAETPATPPTEAPNNMPYPFFTICSYNGLNGFFFDPSDQSQPTMKKFMEVSNECMFRFGNCNGTVPFHFDDVGRVKFHSFWK